MEREKALPCKLCRKEDAAFINKVKALLETQTEEQDAPK